MKFNKDVFLNEITEKVQSAIDKNLLTIEDVRNDNKERLAGFLQYELLNYIEDRKFAIDVLKDFNFDERRDWRTLQEEYGEFRSLMDIALINLWKYLESEGATNYSYYEHDDKKTDHMLDIVHDKEDFQDPRSNDEADGTPGENGDMEVNFDALGGQGQNNGVSSEENGGEMEERPRRKIRKAKPE